MKIETSAKPRQKSTALASRGMRTSTLARRWPSGGVDKAGDQSIGDRLPAGHVQPLGMAAFQHQSRFLAREPARLGDLAAVDADLGRLGTPDAAEHQRMR